MASNTLEQIKADMKEAMKAKQKERLATVRLILAQVKQYEVDERKEVSDEVMINILTKMAKQRKESIEQYSKAGRDDLTAQENTELEIIQAYLPQPLSVEELDTIISDVMTQFDAPQMKDMGNIMSQIKPKVLGRADMSQLSAKVKEKLS